MKIFKSTGTWEARKPESSSTTAKAKEQSFGKKENAAPVKKDAVKSAEFIEEDDDDF